jgi:uncharacterized iron-regulated membrane protein
VLFGKQCAGHYWPTGRAKRGGQSRRVARVHDVKRIRPFLVVLHRYAGLFLGVLLLVEAVTGCAIVFEKEIDRLLNPHLYPMRQQAVELPLDGIVDRAIATMGEGWQVLRVRFPDAELAGYMVLLRGNANTGGHMKQVFVDAHSGAVLGVRGAEDTVLQILRRLHADVYLGEVGVFVLLGAAFVFIALTITGPFLWRPRGRLPADWFKIKWSANRVRQYYDLHKVLGFWLSPLLMVSAFTSIYMLDPSLTEAAVKLAFPLKTWHAQDPDARDGATPLAKMIAVAQAHYPEARPANLYFPRELSKPYLIDLFAPNSIDNGHSGAIKLAIDPQTSSILRATTPAQFSVGDHIMQWQYPLHNGYAFGLSGRILVFIGGACLSMSFLTGFYIWLRKKKSSRVALRRDKERRLTLKKEGVIKA